MKNTFTLILCSTLMMVEMIFADDIIEKENLNDSIRSMSESILLEESINVEQAAFQAENSSTFGMELRPNVTDNDAGLGLRIYLPEMFTNKKQKEQLELISESEQLRMENLELNQLLDVYSDFCTYRMLQDQLTIYKKEITFIEPYLEQADTKVKQHQLAVIDRANLYSNYLDYLNNQEKVRIKLINIKQQLHLILGSKANLDAFSTNTIVRLPDQLDSKILLNQAIENRADYQLLEVQSQTLENAEDIARSKEGFHIKYIQPEYAIDYNGGEDTWGVSASLELPWGRKNKDVAVYQQKKAMTLATMSQQYKIIEERLKVLIDISVALKTQIQNSKETTTPLIAQLENDLQQIPDDSLIQIQDKLNIRKQILESALLTTQTKQEYELIAVKLAEELGTFTAE